MIVDLARLLFDFGLVVLIWLVQLVIYPSFRHYSRQNLLNWHERYTVQVTYVVLPLMAGQVLTTAWQLWHSFDWYTITSTLLIGSMWASTFFRFVPLHGQISEGKFDRADLDRLVSENWQRTAVWSAIFLLSVAWFCLP